MTTAGEILNPQPLIVAPDLSVQALAALLLERGVDGACVVGGGGLEGVVTAMDLVFKEKNLHLPTVFTFMDVVIPLGWQRAEEELEKIAGLKVADIMTRHPVTVGPEADLHTVATLMVEKHLSTLPVVEGGQLRGVIDKRAVLAAAFPQARG